ncbi:unnamed protein product [Tilletia controversa]|uniref:Peptidase A1 domain-containing protein n=1 Tax=Tilletia caries TaxID=13290 RepID=A0ABN7IGP5_9BASI|nr:hypothetical protein CF328_g8358 [Tilletia controversa]KAE8183497.1 hypothetical protein CF335_g8305 [Tilletia laevis]CAD6884059.1 unnamed protein product [Tilletia caries]CAD6897157.1 unnamed protein product [Tilletia caries]CAD6897671.1 unnamed protein product [Tilletia controversa]
MNFPANLTFSILPAPLALAKQIAGDDYPLLSSFRDYLPADVSATIGADQHPLFVIGYFSTDIHYATVPFALPTLSSAQSFVGFVDCTGDGKTPCYRQWSGYFDELIPVLAGNVLAGTRLFAGSFDPPHSPYTPIGSGRYGLNVSDLLVGLVGGGRPFTSSFEFTTSPGGLDGKVAQQLLDGPIVRSYDSRCLKSIFFFNETTTPIRSIVGDIDVRSPLLPSQGLASQQLSVKGALGVAAAVQRALTTQGANCSIYAGMA